MLLNCITLTYPDPANPLALSCDASDVAAGAVLEEFQDGQWKPLGMWSKSFSKAQQSWSVFRRELFSIQMAIRNFQPDIYGRDLIIYTDHRPILGAMTSPNFQVNDPVATRALLEISQYSHDVKFKAGKFNVTADALSRPHNIPPGDAYCAEPNVVAAAKELVTTELQPQNIFAAQAQCKEVADQLLNKKSPKTKTQVVDFKGFQLLCQIDGDKAKPFIPVSLRNTVLKAVHDIDHAGQAETKRRLLSAYYWPKASKNVSFYVKSCHP